MKKRAQEEMVGFAVIIVIVAVIILIFLGFSLRKGGNENIIESYEIESFIQATLQQTIEYNQNFISIRELIRECERYDEGCEQLKGELEDILKESWNINEGSKTKGYILRIYAIDNEVININQGNETNTYKGSSQSLVDNVKVSLTVYY